MNKRVGRPGAGPWGFPTTPQGVSSDHKVRRSGPVSFDPRVAPLPEHGVVEQIDPDQRRRQTVWALEDDLPDPVRFAALVAEFMKKSRAPIDLDDPTLSDQENERLSRLLTDEAALIELLRRTEGLRQEVRARAASERPS